MRWTTGRSQNTCTSGLKGDQARQGVTLVVGRTDNDLGPLAAVLPYVVLRGGPFFRWKVKGAMTREALGEKLRQILRAAGVNWQILGPFI